MLFIGGGSRSRKQAPKEANDLLVRTATATQTVVAELHNIPNQAIEFVGDDYGPRKEDEIIAYMWRKFMEAGAPDSLAHYLPRFPMTTAAVRAMDVLETFSASRMPSTQLEDFVVAGASKRGWTTWTTGLVDERVIGIIPIVIDMLNVVPSFDHHWRAYGFWAPAVGNYEHEGVMEWQGSKEYARLQEIVEPYSYRERLTLPKLMINGTGDEFFLPDSWQFYWDELKGEKHIRYVPNGNHSLRGTDAIVTLVTYYNRLVNNTPLPKYDWEVKDGVIHIQTYPESPLKSLKLWQASNAKGRDFRIETIGRAWTSEDIPLNDEGKYELRVEMPKEGWTAFLGELVFEGIGPFPLKLSTGVLVVPETLPHEPFQSEAPMGTQE